MFARRGGPLFYLRRTGLELNNLSRRRLAGHERHDVSGPAVQRALAFGAVNRLIVDTAHTGLMADMAKQHFDNVRRHTELVMQCGGERASKIVQNPVRQRLAVEFCEVLVERDLGCRSRARR